MVNIKELPLITSAEVFFNVNKVLYVEVIDINDAPRKLKRDLEKQGKTFIFKNRTYYPVTLKGSPENIILKPLLQLPWGGLLVFDGDLQSALNAKKIYDISDIYTPNKMEIVKDVQFLAEIYILPYLK